MENRRWEEIRRKSGTTVRVFELESLPQQIRRAGLDVVHDSVDLDACIAMRLELTAKEEPTEDEREAINMPTVAIQTYEMKSTPRGGTE